MEMEKVGDRSWTGHIKVCCGGLFYLGQQFKQDYILRGIGANIQENLQNSRKENYGFM